ncbi:MAG: hypothetical protein JKY23_00280 [Nitrospinaceae bacterium]|nr:hypothetical protein [Nitrospinaceae bacterium]
MKQAMAIIRARLDKMTVQFGTMTTELDKNRLFDQDVLRRDEMTADQIGFIQQATLRTQGVLSGLNDDIVDLVTIQDAYANSTNRNFAALKAQVSANANLSRTEWNATVNFMTETTRRFYEIVHRIGGVTRQVTSIEVLLMSMYKQVEMRRSVISLFHEVSTVATPIATTPFLGYLGEAPYTEAQLNALGNRNSARRVASVYLERTVLRGGTDYWAQWINLTYACDPRYIIQNIVPFLSVEALFGSIGPGGCYSGSPAAPWTCNCVILVETEECLVTSHPSRRFPWSWPVNTTYLLPMNPGSCGSGDDLVPGCQSKCTLPIVHRAPLVLDNRVGVEAYMSGLCSGSDGDVALPDVSATATVPPAKVRIYSMLYGTYSDLTLDPAVAGSDVCSGEFAVEHRAGQNEALFLGYHVYYMWLLMYQRGVSTWIPEVEELLMGKVASNLYFREVPFDVDAKYQQTHRCTEFAFARTTSTKLPVYVDILNSVQTSMQVTVGTQLIQGPLTASPVTSSHRISIALNGLTSGGNVTVTTAIDLSNNVVNVLPGLFRRVGLWRGPTNLESTWDVPGEQLCPGELPQSRAACMNYISQGANWTGVTDSSPITIEEWKSNYHAYFNPHNLGDSPSSYRRQLFTSGTQATCSGSYDIDGTPIATTTSENFWCEILRNYDVSTVGADQEEMWFKPRAFAYTTTVEVPGGSFIQRLTSFCPSSLRVVETAGDVHVELNTTVPELITVRIKVTSRDLPSDPACVFHDQDDTMSIIKPFRLDIPFSALCSPYMLNVRPVDSTQWCYGVEGRVIDSSHVIEDGSGVPGPVQIAISYSEDRVLDDLLNQLATSEAFSWNLTQLQFSTLSDQDLDAHITTMETDRINSIDKMKLGTGAYAKIIAAAKARIAANVAAARKAIAKSRSDITHSIGLNLAIAKLDHNMSRVVEQLVALGLLGDEEQANGTVQEKRLDAIIQRFLDSGNPHKCGFLSFLCDIFHSLFGGIFGALFDGIKNFIFMVIMLVLMVFVGKIMFKKCMNHHSSGGSGGATGGPVMNYTPWSPPPATAAAPLSTEQIHGPPKITRVDGTVEGDPGEGASLLAKDPTAPATGGFMEMLPLQDSADIHFDS